MAIDLLLVQPVHIDFPLFRETLAKYRWYFDRVLIALSPTNVSPNDLSTFFREHMKHVEFLQPPALKPDWRDNAVEDLLTNSTAEYVLFLEQDFLIKDGLVLEFASNFEGPFLGYKEGDRIHPAFALVKRSLLNRTTRDFAAHPEVGLDHFGQFFHEISKMCEMHFLPEYGFHSMYHYYHLNGTTQNFFCYMQKQPLYKPDEFLSYIDGTLTLLSPQPPEFREMCEDIKKQYGSGNSKVVSSFFL